MGYARGALTCLISSTSTQRPENFYSYVPTYQQHLRHKRCIAKKLILTIRAIMIGQLIDLVSGDFNRTAWRCSNRDNISSIDEAFADCTSPTPVVPTPLWGPRSIPNNWADVWNQIGIGRYACMVLSPSQAKLSACVQPIKAATMRHGSTWISSIGAIPNHITKNLTDELYSNSVLRHVPVGSRKGVSVK